MNLEISKIANLPTAYGDFKIQSFKQNDKEHLAIFTFTIPQIPTVRIHSECLTGDVLKSLKCDCGEQLDFALKTIQKDFDICLIDTNPNPDIRLTIALATSNYVLSPIQLNQEALDGIAALKRDIHTIQTVNKNLKFIGILPNLVEPTPFQKDNFVELVTRYKEMMISLNNDTVASIAKRSIIAEAQAAAMPFWKMPKSTARTTWNEIKPIFDFIKETMGV